MDIRKSISIANLVPYTGAKKDVDLGGHNIQGGNLSGVNTGDQNLSGLVPYSGAISDVNLGSHGIIQAAFKLTASPGDGKILTSDANGQGSWQNPASTWNNSCVGIYNDSDQTIGTESSVVVFDKVVFDVLGEADLTNNRITVAEGGYYLAIGAARSSADFANDVLTTDFEVNGNRIGPTIAGGCSGSWPNSQISQIIWLNAGDYVQLETYNPTGNSVTIVAYWNGLLLRRIL